MNREPVSALISQLHPDGYGLTEDGRLAVLSALPGEQVTAVPFTRKKKRTFSRLQNIAVASSDRVVPECAVADICGGCSLQHLGRDAQVAFKQKRWLAGFDVPPDELLPPLLGRQFGYRAKARLSVRYVARKQRVLVGFREKMSRVVAETDLCKVLREPVGSLLVPLSEVIGELTAPEDIPQIEVAVGDAGFALVIRHMSTLSQADQTLLAGFAGRTGADIYLQSGGVDTISPLDPERVYPLLYYDLPAEGLRFYFKPLDFTQVNHEINEAMVRLAISLLELSPSHRVLDAFCGIGNFSLPLSNHCARVVGIEGSDESVQRARYNAQQNGIRNVEFHTRDLFEASLADLLESEPFDSVLIDPPRSGAERLVKTLAASEVRRVVYVSCNPDTLARDAAILKGEGGFQFARAGVIDMFPHTTHIESIALFCR